MISYLIDTDWIIDFLKGKREKIFGKQRAILRRNGRLIDNFDLLLAATCLYYDLILMTNNINHFDRVKGLKTGIKK